MNRALLILLFAALNTFAGTFTKVATLVPVGILIFEHDVVGLASLYAIGVVGAITLNLGSSGTNLKLDMNVKERILLLTGAVILFFVEITIAIQKHQTRLAVHIVFC